MSVWSKDHNPETSIKRNVFPQSFCNNLTFNFGKIVPFFVAPVMSGDTWSIDSAYGLRFWPTAFPNQNRIRLDGHFFYVRSRNLYNEFKEHYTGGEVEKPMPYLSNLKPEDFKNGSLMDYMNIPTVVHFSDGDVVFTPKSSLLMGSFADFNVLYNGKGVFGNFPPVGSSLDIVSFFETSTDLVVPRPMKIGSAGLPFSNFYCMFRFPKLPINNFKVDSVGSALDKLASTSVDLGVLPVVQRVLRYDGTLHSYTVPCGSFVSSIFVNDGEDETLDELTYSFDFDSYPGSVNLPENYDIIEDRIGFVLIPTSSMASGDTVDLKAASGDIPFSLYSLGSSQIQLSDLDESFNPFVGANPKIPLNALPFRAYEQIYNAFFRDERNNPYTINGKVYYDKYLPTLDGGSDPNKYDLRNRNWEQDFLTTALPSPQQGEAPLVGISSTGVMSISDENGNVYHAQAITADDNDTIVGAKFIQTNQDGTSIPNNVARSLVSYATSGISINDFRNVNALQRYLETNLRRGLKYRDLVAARWGVNISYAEMNMPEFIGGFTDYITPSQVNQTSQDNDGAPLGSFAGQLHCQGSQKHKIRHFCDEEGFIIGVVSVVPVPVYSQLLPKMFTKFDRLDFFQPEFGHIGMQPIPMKEVAPLQVAMNNGNQDETFGYQRAWYDYLGRVDEVHGQMRGSLRDYLMYRTFSGIPRLGKDFLLVDNKPLDNVFTVQRDADGNSVDKIIGQIYIDAVAKRPIPRFGTPRLE